MHFVKTWNVGSFCLIKESTLEPRRALRMGDRKDMWYLGRKKKSCSAEYGGEGRDVAFQFFVVGKRVCSFSGTGEIGF